MRTVKKAEERREEILDAAERLFTVKGYAATSVMDILAETGIAKGTLYYYFQSKEEIMDAVVMRYIGRQADAFWEIARAEGLSAVEKIEKILTASGQSNNEKAQLLAVLHEPENAQMHQKSNYESIRHTTPILTAVLEQGIREGVFQTEHPRVTMEVVLSSSEVMFDCMYMESAESQIERMQAFAAILEKLLGAKKGTFDFLPKVMIKNLETQA